jgi:signal transduction histidine kinase
MGLAILKVKTMTEVPEQLTPEMLVPRLGEYLVAGGQVSEANLHKALDYQQERIAAGHPCLLGQALVELDLLDQAALDRAVTKQILQLRSALQAANRSLERRVRERTAELQEALERLKELNQLKANFVSNISHELRTPLAHIKGYVELLAADSLGPLTDEQRHALQVSQRAVTRLERLIDDLIMFAMSSRGELSIRQESVDLVQLVNPIVITASQQAEGRGVSVQAVLEKRLPSVRADSQKISWVISQLLDNAIKFTPSGGQVILEMKRKSDKLVSVTVTDTGIGIPADRLGELFEPFHQLDGSSTRRYGGTGLGLSLVRQIIEAHGSIIEVQSTEGEGSCFKFSLLETPSDDS